jgi:hypothetical protein
MTWAADVEYQMLEETLGIGGNRRITDPGRMRECGRDFPPIFHWQRRFDNLQLGISGRTGAWAGGFESSGEEFSMNAAEICTSR